MKLSAYKAGFIVYLSLMSLAFIFYKERTIFTDNAMHLFEIVRRQDFAYFDNLRFGAFFTQSFAVIPVRFSFSLANVQLLYSLGFIIYYGLMYFLCGQVFRQYSLAFALLLCNILFVGHAFFLDGIRTAARHCFHVYCFWRSGVCCQANAPNAVWPSGICIAYLNCFIFSPLDDCSARLLISFLLSRGLTIFKEEVDLVCSYHCRGIYF